MELRVVEEDEKKLVLEIEGETFTLTNMLREELWSDKSVAEAASIKRHPYLDQPKILVKVYRGNPKNALEKAASRIVDKSKDFKEEFKRALKK